MIEPDLNNLEVRSQAIETPRDRLGDLLLEAAAKDDTQLAQLLEDPMPPTPPAWLVDPSREWNDAAGSVMLAVAERLHHEGRHAECLDWLGAIRGAKVYSPALRCYLRAIASRQTVDYQGVRAALEELDELGDVELSPSRLAVIRELRHEFESDDPEGLTRVARLMQDAERRLAVDRPDPPTQSQQQRAIDALDVLIKALEEQQRSQQMSQSGGASGMGSPADDSRPSELKGEGEVDRKRFATGDGWGNLPPAEREKLTQDLTRGFPERYRALIGDYFEAIADESERDESDGSSRGGGP